MSRLVRHKGYPELLAAMATCRARSCGWWASGCRPTAARISAPRWPQQPGRVRRLGYRTDVAAILAAADIFALPSHFEGLPMSVIEAMLTGLPVVATDIRGPREQVVDGVTGLLVPPGTVAPLAGALRRLVGDPALRAAMGAAGRRRALERYDEAAVVTRTLDLLGL